MGNEYWRTYIYYYLITYVTTLSYLLLRGLEHDHPLVSSELLAPAEGTPVAHLAERKVQVSAVLADPVSGSLGQRLLQTLQAVFLFFRLVLWLDLI
jgi:hypothetical protein